MITNIQWNVIYEDTNEPLKLLVGVKFILLVLTGKSNNRGSVKEKKTDRSFIQVNKSRRNDLVVVLIGARDGSGIF